jgi:hypothetical protein
MIGGNIHKEAATRLSSEHSSPLAKIKDGMRAG